MKKSAVNNLKKSTPFFKSSSFVIPAIDLIEGKCVRLTRGNFNEKVTYAENPLEVAKEFEAAGLQRLHLVDLDGARAGKVRNWKVLESIATHTSLLIDFSGGIRTEHEVRNCFRAGAAFVAIGSMAVTQEQTVTHWLSEFGTDKFIIGVDVKEEKIAIQGWTQTTDHSVFDLMDTYKRKGVKQFFCTDISKDGLLQGPNLSLYKKIINRFPSLDLIASGGISTVQELILLREAGCSGAIVGKAFYEKKILLKDMKMFLA